MNLLSKLNFVVSSYHFRLGYVAQTLVGVTQEARRLRSPDAMTRYPGSLKDGHPMQAGLYAGYPYMIIPYGKSRAKGIMAWGINLVFILIKSLHGVSISLIFVSY